MLYPCQLRYVSNDDWIHDTGLLSALKPDAIVRVPPKSPPLPSTPLSSVFSLIRREELQKGFGLLSRPGTSKEKRWVENAMPFPESTTTTENSERILFHGQRLFDWPSTSRKTDNDISCRKKRKRLLTPWLIPWRAWRSYQKSSIECEKIHFFEIHTPFF